MHRSVKPKRNARQIAEKPSDLSVNVNLVIINNHNINKKIVHFIKFAIKHDTFTAITHNVFVGSALHKKY